MTDLKPPLLAVVSIDGRYPVDPGRFDSGNLHVQTLCFGNVVILRIDDESAPDAWFEITMKVEGANT